MNIGLDLDGVLYPWHEQVWKELTDDGFVTGSFDHYWSTYETWRAEGKNEQVFMNAINDVSMYTRSSPYWGVRAMLKRLDKNHKLWYITQRPQHLELPTSNWLKHWRLPQRENLIVTQNGKKLAVIEKEIDLMAEDSPKYAPELRNFTTVVIVRKPWNVDIRKDFHCVDSVLEIEELINEGI